MLKQRAAWILAAITSVGLLACGHTEEEWQAQLGQYNAELTKTRALQAKLGEQDQQLQQEKARVAELEQQLASMGLDVSKLNEAVESKGKALSEASANIADMRKALDDYKARARILETIKARMLELRHKLDALTQMGLKVNIRKNRMLISLPGDILFESGKTDLKDDGKKVLLQVADVIHNDSTLLARDFQVVGHTDNKAFTGGPFFDNWGLSVMRARQVLLFLTTARDVQARGYGPTKVEPGGGLPVARFSAAGYAETDPVAPNDTPENMKKNRRVELVVVPNVEEMLDLKSLTNVGN
jgi:chemotaxis protein MotB